MCVTCRTRYNSDPPERVHGGGLPRKNVPRLRLPTRAQDTMCISVTHVSREHCRVMGKILFAPPRVFESVVKPLRSGSRARFAMPSRCFTSPRRNASPLACNLVTTTRSGDGKGQSPNCTFHSYLLFVLLRLVLLLVLFLPLFFSSFSFFLFFLFFLPVLRLACVLTGMSLGKPPRSCSVNDGVCVRAALHDFRRGGGRRGAEGGGRSGGRKGRRRRRRRW